MVTDPVTTDPLSHQWQRKEMGKAWTNIQGATGATYTTSDGIRGQYVRLVQKTNSGATGVSNELEVTNILNSNLIEGIQQPLWPQNQGNPTTFKAAGGGVDAGGLTTFFQTADVAWFIAADGVFEEWAYPEGAAQWPSFMTMPRGGSALSEDGNYVVMMPGQKGTLTVTRAGGGTGVGGWNFMTKPDYTQVVTGSKYGYCSATVPGLNNTCYGIPADYDKVLWAVPDPVYKDNPSAGRGEITIEKNGSAIDLNQWYKWGKGTLAADGKIYCPPARALTKEILIIDTNNKTAEIGPAVPEAQNPEGKTLYDSSCMGKDGKIYFSPVGTGYMTSFDPVTQMVDHWDDDDYRPGGNPASGVRYGYNGLVLYPDGFLYGLMKRPREGCQLVQIDTDNKEINITDFPDEFIGTRPFLDLDGNIIWTTKTGGKGINWNRGYGPGPWPMPGVPGDILDPRLPYFGGSYG